MRVEPDKLTGSVSGAATVIGFALVHDVWIADIWFNIVPMVVSGAVCGLSIVWSYQRATRDHSWSRWLGYNALSAILLVALGGSSFLVFEPRFSMAELMGADDALSSVLPPAMPLIAAGTVVGTLVVWIMYGRRSSALLAIFVTQGLLMFLVGHNLAILGLVDIPTDQMYRVLEFVGVTFFLAAGFAVSAMALAGVRRMGVWTRHSQRETEIA